MIVALFLACAAGGAIPGGVPPPAAGGAIPGGVPPPAAGGAIPGGVPPPPAEAGPPGLLDVRPDGVPEVTFSEEPAPPALPPPSPLGAEQLYAACRDRVEGAQVPGECLADTDCAPAGCSQEVCVPAAKAPDVVTTCEILPCFSVLDACGCHDAQCSWTLKEPAPPKLRRPE